MTYKGYRSVIDDQLPGKPDLVFPKKRVLIFVDGCFWHGCPKCNKHAGLTEESWVSKIRGNVVRDRNVTKQLSDAGWTVFRIPEHEVNTKAALAMTIDRLIALLEAAPPAGAQSG